MRLRIFVIKSIEVAGSNTGSRSTKCLCCAVMVDNCVFVCGLWSLSTEWHNSTLPGGVLNIECNVIYQQRIWIISSQTGAESLDGVQVWILCFWDGKSKSGSKQRKRGKQKKGYRKSLCSLQLLRNLCPALCRQLQGAGVELDPGGERETGKRGEEKRSSINSPLRLWQTGTTDSETSHWLDTPKNTGAHALCFPRITLPHFSKAWTSTHIPQCGASLLLSAWGGGVVWNIFIPLWLHHSVIT